MRAAALVIAAAFAAAAGGPGASQSAGAPGQPRVSNGRLASQPAGSNLDAVFGRLVSAQSGPGWIGYAVPVVNRSEGRLCCRGDTWISDGIVFTNGRMATCGLEPSTTTRRPSDQPAQMQNPVRLEGPDSLVVLYRVEDKTVQKIRIVSPDCELDAGGLTIQWLDGVSGADSVKLLSTFVSKAEVRSDRITDAAISAIAMHKDEAADAALERLGGKDNPELVRKKVTFWMGNARGPRGVATGKGIARHEPGEEHRK